MLVAFASAKGSPGVTTTAAALGSVWPADVVVADMDPAGGDLALRLRAPQERPLDPERGLLSLAAAARRGLEPGEIAAHTQTTDGGLDVLTGVSSPEQVTGIGPVWPAVAFAF
jgi:MinD-like ATPase involved in chromosome partitioning or flagellar assembly